MVPAHRLYQHPQQTYLRERQERGICYQCSEDYHWAGMLGVDLCHTCQNSLSQRAVKTVKEASTFPVQKILWQPVPRYGPALTAEGLQSSPGERQQSWRWEGRDSATRGEHWLLRDPPNVSQQRAQAEPAGGTARNRLPALVLPLHTDTPTGAHWASQRLYFQTLEHLHTSVLLYSTGTKPLRSDRVHL